MKRHFQISSLSNRVEHSRFGGSQFAFESCIKIQNGFKSALVSSACEIDDYPTLKFQAFINRARFDHSLLSVERCQFTRGSQKTPESDTPQICLGLGTRVRRQSTQRYVAIPPADEPLTIILSAWLKLYWLSAHLRCERVLTAPRKQSSASLYLTGDKLLPWWKAPSQYMMTTLVQRAKLFFAGSVSKMPPFAALYVSGQVFEVPNCPLLLLQQDSSVEARSVPIQTPPPIIYSKMFLVSPPSCRQMIGGLPSRHLAQGSVL